ncbi:helix-turn-helix domain-containing protein [Streptomyces sp. NBC_00249]|uniref:helix-turn-helix domain-containing protein n=1 Tax=Streptomyces sp. NBC_00249 TaxID=2975690 RepID=UPI002255211C|nr:helix-turn-helix transcriptional regulator [Streptomyces sp. NBC_00249]MCX5192794.1 helix-turn-helix domain-containing protein [Streptomyces sp. NBC_00249]
MPAFPEPLSEPPPASLAPVLPLGREPGRAAAGRVLGQALRGHREDRGLTLREVAAVIRSSVSKVSRLERGESPPKARDVHDLIRHYGLDQEEIRTIERLLEFAQDCEWYEQYSDVTPGFLRRLIQLEGDAEEICVYENLVIPGILQLPEYAWHMVRAVMPSAPDAEIERVVQLRTQRRLRLMEGEAPRLTALLDEGVLKRRCGNARVMREQLTYLLEAGDRAKVNIRILDMTSGYVAAPPYPITHLTFRDGGPGELAYVEHINGANYVTRPRALDDHRNALSNLRVAAASRDRSRAMILEALEAFR